MSDLVLSHSSISTYLRCHYRYYLGSVLRFSGAGSIAPVLGVATHAGIEAHYRGEDPATAFHAAWDREVASVPAAEVAADPDAIPDGLRMVAVYIEKAAVPDPVLIEAPFLLRMDGVTLSGIIDLGTAEDVRDTKSTAGKTINGKKPSQFTPENHRLQLTLYALGFRSLTQQAPRRLLLDVVSRRGTYRQFEVQPDFGGLREVVSLVAQGISRGDYEPTGALSGACTYCEFATAHCRYSTVRGSDT